MRSRPSGSRLRLSRLFSLLGSACMVKLVVLGLLMNDCLPDFLRDKAGDDATAVAVENQPQAGAKAPASPKKEAGPEAPINAPEAVVTSEDLRTPPRFAAKGADEIPQGAAAAQLAAAARPRRSQAAGSVMPKPQFARPGQSAFANDIINVSLPTPPPLGAPLAPAGEPAPLVTAMPGQKKMIDPSLADMLGLRQLPIPGLGSVQVAHAAAMDMPVPQSPSQSNSPFAPAAQLAPLQGGANAPSGAGTPLPPRSSGQAPKSSLPTLPNGNQAGSAQAMPPAPAVTPMPRAHDPNDKAQELARQQQDVLILRQQMDQRLKDLESAEKKMKDMIREAKDLEDKKIRNLIQMYANMKPRTAAQALENMEERVAIRILSGMAPKQSGEILTYTDPNKTAKLTELITRMRMQE